MERITGLWEEYLDKVVTWYGGLTFLEQAGVLFGLFVAVGLIVALYLIKRAAS
ncbi:MAG TPA: hypothetical protein PK836_03860 [Syntrophales bacterium]|nr:hypothetical protein [Syntrophales bacterium]HOM07767.1 hypothetical protein [Syntrophales bacterium]HON99464.1 hypothetical protein [Syntrophales bacterium]HPC00801.1 hypothetical protein [Syntrophales bacterium]HPQ06001.1 hypothetical protein [Syntrophales bacterium]